MYGGRREVRKTTSKARQGAHAVEGDVVTGVHGRWSAMEPRRRYIRQGGSADRAHECMMAVGACNSDDK